MNIFDYNSKFNQMLMIVADLIILNILYVVFSIPLFTIGAAQAGLFTGIKVLLDKEDDSSCAKAFFRGFGSGFKTVTVAHLILSVFVLIFGYLLATNVNIMIKTDEGSMLALIFCGLGFLIFYAMHCILGPFHATFGCTPGQLIRNSLFVTIAYPGRALLGAVIMALPLVVLLIDLNLLLRALLAILVIYYSTAYLLCFTLLKKPFQRLKDSFYAAQNEEPGSSEADQTDDETDPDESVHGEA